MENFLCLFDGEHKTNLVTLFEKESLHCDQKDWRKQLRNHLQEAKLHCACQPTEVFLLVIRNNDKNLANNISNQTRIIEPLLNSTSYRVNVMMEHSKGNMANFNKLEKQINNNTRNLFR